MGPPDGTLFATLPGQAGGGNTPSPYSFEGRRRNEYGFHRLLAGTPGGGGKLAWVKYLTVKVPKNRIEVQIFNQHSVNVVLPKTTRNNLSDNF